MANTTHLLVGGRSGSHGSDTSVVYRWDGTSWTKVIDDARIQNGINYSKVRGTSNGSLIMATKLYTGGPRIQISYDGGISWTETTASVGPTGYRGLHVVSDTEAWIVGFGGFSGGGNNMRWNGVDWAVSDPTDVSRGSYSIWMNSDASSGSIEIRSVTSTGGGRLWDGTSWTNTDNWAGSATRWSVFGFEDGAPGNGGSDIYHGGSFNTKIGRYNSAIGNWVSEAPNTVDEDLVGLWGYSASSGKQMWAIGYSGSFGNDDQGVIYHSTSVSGWERQSYGELFKIKDIYGISDTEVYAVGGGDEGSAGLRGSSSIIQYDGVSWSPFATQLPDADVDIRTVFAYSFSTPSPQPCTATKIDSDFTLNHFVCLSSERFDEEGNNKVSTGLPFGLGIPGLHIRKPK